MAIRRKIHLENRSVFFVTTSVSSFVPIFMYPVLARFIQKQLIESVNHYDGMLHAYVIMPTHIHFIIEFDTGKVLSKFMRSFKTISSKRLKSLMNRKQQLQFETINGFRFWHRDYDDFTIISEKQYRIKTDYVIYNPVKAGIVNNAEEYEYSSAYIKL